MKKKILGWLLFFILISTAISYGVLQYSYSNGQRTGRLVKLSKKGFFPKTYEGTLDLGSGDRLTWDFSIHDEKLGKQIIGHSGKMITLEYRELLWKILYETKYDVTGFKLIDQGTSSTEFLCRFVQVLRQNKKLVEAIRPMILRYDFELLPHIQKCQN